MCGERIVSYPGNPVSEAKTECDKKADECQADLSKNGLNRMTMLVVYTRNGGKGSANDVRFRVSEQVKAGFPENGYARYSDYAKKQSNEMLNARHDWNLFEHECDTLGKIDGGLPAV